MSRHLSFITSVSAIALIASPLAAQQSVQDFSLQPNPTPTPSPDVAGPVDDSGPVPIAPRAIPTQTPAPQPTPLPVQPTPAPAPTSVPTPSATNTPSATPSSTPPVQRTPAPQPTASELDSTESPEPDAPPSALDSLENFTPEPVAPSPTAAPATIDAESATLPNWWPWAAAALAGLLALLAGLWVFARHRANRPPQEIEPPLGRQDSSATIEPPKINITMHVERMTRSMMMLTLNYRLIIANRSPRTLRDVAIAADMISSSRSRAMEAQLAGLETRLPYLGMIDRIGPHQSASFAGSIQLAIGEVEAFYQGQTPLCIPLMRLRVDGGILEPHVRNFVIGLGSGIAGGRVHPLPLSGPPGSYDGVQGRTLEPVTA